jgi:hypothetical protein
MWENAVGFFLVVQNSDKERNRKHLLLFLKTEFIPWFFFLVYEDTTYSKRLFRGHSYAVGRTVIPAVAGVALRPAFRCSNTIVVVVVAVVVRDDIVLKVVVEVHTAVGALQWLETVGAAVELQKLAVPIVGCIAVVIVGAGVIDVAPVVGYMTGGRKNGFVAVDFCARNPVDWPFLYVGGVYLLFGLLLNVNPC